MIENVLDQEKYTILKQQQEWLMKKKLVKVIEVYWNVKYFKVFYHI